MKMRSVNIELFSYINKKIIPQYDAFDSAHQKDHVESVIERSLSLSCHYDVNKDMVYTVAAYHDVGLSKGRTDHHINSGIYLMQDKNLSKWFDHSQMETMRDAIEEHRASSGIESRSDRKSTRLNSSHEIPTRIPSSA